MHTTVPTSIRRRCALLLPVLALAGAARSQDEPTAPPQGQPQEQSPATPPRPPGGAPPSKDALKMGSPPQLAPGTTEQQMWPAATAEGWKKPVLIPWQRSFDDALRVAKATNKPILVAVNMDGEIASEHYAGVRYREPGTAKLFEPYVCVVASVYRHTPRDHDEHGRRILCPRLGDVTCGEHIAAETELYDKYFEGIRISPRHIALELDGTKTYDVYFSWDTQTVFTALVKGAENRPPPTPLLRDLPIVDRTQSADVQDRTDVETTYQTATPEVRRELIKAVVARRTVDQVDLLRLAVFGLDLEAARLARQALAQSETEPAVDLIAEALKAPLAADERELLIAASARMAKKYPRARTLTALHQGLAQTSKWVDARRWSEIEYEARARAAGVGEARTLETRATQAQARPTDTAAHLDLAEAFLARALDPATEKSFAKLLVDDARAAASSARELGGDSWRLASVLAVTSALSGDEEAARAHAVKAVEGGMLMPDASADAVMERTGVRVVALFAQARQMAIRSAYRAGTGWPPEWLADVNAAYALLSKHPLGTDDNLVSFYDFLRWLGGTTRANGILDDALARFPGSPLVHDRLRARLLWESGPDGLEGAYADRLAKEPANSDLVWFAGYASLVAAENHRRAGDAEKAFGAYERGIAHYESFVAQRPEGRTSADHFVALALAGRARLALDARDYAAATRQIVAAFARSPESAASPDGLNITPADTAKMLREQLINQPMELAVELQRALDALDPKLLEKRAFELDNPTPRPRRNPPRQPPTDPPK